MRAIAMTALTLVCSYEGSRDDGSACPSLAEGNLRDDAILLCDLRTRDVDIDGSATGNSDMASCTANAQLHTAGSTLSHCSDPARTTSRRSTRRTEASRVTAGWMDG